METGWRCSLNSGGSQGRNGIFTNTAWDIGTTATSASGRCYDWSNLDASGSIPATSGPDDDGGAVHANHHRSRMPEPHMMCLKLGKRHYCGDAVVPEPPSSATTKRSAKPPLLYPTTTNGVPRCQVEGCHVALNNAKEYYRRHKVCEIHSKAPKVVVLGLLQRFCQQCSRFHGVTEFDEAKRSCRRRLEGHNQRRRKSTISNSLITRNPSHSHGNSLKVGEPPAPPSSCALSLLSSPKTEPWISSADLSSRRSAALCELIAANRATAFVGNQNGSHEPVVENVDHTTPNTPMWDRFNDANHTTMTLDLMQGPILDFGILSKPKDLEDWTDYCWSAFGGANVV